MPQADLQNCQSILGTVEKHDGSAKITTAWDQLPRQQGAWGQVSDDSWWKGLRLLCLPEESWREGCCFLSHGEGQGQNGKGWVQGSGQRHQTEDSSGSELTRAGQNSELGPLIPVAPSDPQILKRKASFWICF